MDLWIYVPILSEYVSVLMTSYICTFHFDFLLFKSFENYFSLSKFLTHLNLEFSILSSMNAFWDLQEHGFTQYGIQCSSSILVSEYLIFSISVRMLYISPLYCSQRLSHASLIDNLLFALNQKQILSFRLCSGSSVYISSSICKINLVIVSLSFFS